METLNLGEILKVSQFDAEQISPPSYLLHENDSTYFYAVRRSNGCGQQEHTLAAAVKIVFDAAGNIAKPQPNSVLSCLAEKVKPDTVRLLWYYCPVAQPSEPVFFKLYGDNGTGQIDYENPIAVIDYEGRRFYSRRIDSLGQGRHLFCVKAVDSSGAESSSLAATRVHLHDSDVSEVELFGVEAI